MESPRALPRRLSRTGVVLKAHASASARALLSTLPVEEVLELYPSPRLPNSQPGTITLRSDRLDELERARERGYAVQHDESEPDVSAGAAPVRVDEGSASFVVTIAVPTSRLSEEAVPVLGEAVVRHPRELATSLPF